MPTNINVYDTGTTDPVTPLAFGEVLAGQTSAEFDVDVVNQGAGSETATEVSFHHDQSTDAGATWGPGEVADGRMIEAAVIATLGTTTEPQTTSFRRVGTGARLLLKPIPATGGRTLRIRLTAPNGPLADDDVLIRFKVTSRERVIPLDMGRAWGGMRGVVSGYGDHSYSAILQGGTIEAAGTPDANLYLVDVLAGVYRGRPVVVYPYTISTIAASAAGNSRWVALTLGAGPTLTVTDGDEVAGTAPETDRPELPADEELVAYVLRDDVAEIGPGSIYATLARMGGFGVVSLVGTTLTLGRGKALAADAILWRDQHVVAPLVDDATNAVYLAPGGLEVVSDGSPPADALAEPLWEVTLASGSEVAGTRRDLRRFIGGEQWAAEFVFPGSLAGAAQTRTVLTPPGREALLRLPLGVQAGVGDAGDRATGTLDFDLEWWDGTAWQPMFSDAGEAPQAPAGELYVAGAIPDVVALPPSTPIRCTVDASGLGGGSVDPSDAHVRVLFELGQ